MTDINDLTRKELDISAFKMWENFIVNLFIECKHTSDKQWVFFLPLEEIILSIDDLRIFPYREKSQDELFPLQLAKSIFNVFKGLCDPTNIALNSAVFKGDQRIENDNTIRSAINSCINALLFNNLHLLKKPTIYFKKAINFALVVFDGLMFAFKHKGKDFKLEQENYIKYQHELNINYWKHPSYIRTLPLIDLYEKYLRKFSHSYIVEIIHRDYFSDYIDILDLSLEKLDKIPKELTKFL